MTPVVPFEPGRTPSASGREFKLADAYSPETLRSFFRKLRELAVVSPEGCELQLQLLDEGLARRIDDAKAGALTHEQYAARLTERLERRYSGRLKPGKPERLRHLLQRASRERPVVVIVIEKLLADTLEELRQRGGAR